MSPTPNPRPTITDVAAAAGVSTSTVSRVLRGDGRVADATRTRVTEVVRDLGYVPTAAARSMRGGSLRTGGGESLGLLIRNIDSPYYARLNLLLQKRLRARGFHVVQETVVGPHPVSEEELLANIASLRVRGILVASGSVPSPVLVEWSSRVPLVVVARPEPSPGLHCIANDEPANGRALAGHLHSLGHRRIVVEVVDPAHSLGSHVRSAALVARARELGVEVTEYDVTAGHDVDDLVDRVVRGTGATAVACLHDRLLLAVWRGLRARGLSVPGDVSLTGSDGLTDGVDLLGLTTVRQPVERIAELAGDLVVDLVGGGGPDPADGPVRRTVPGWLLTGTTAGPPPRR
ncbi:LacI family DNA-binding transcriptional regulator [Corynebacterium bovis]|uniref:LacI family DNA-binding transcriptional regulator n=1 Tax=Corynebacterium bovis TaxID=36808 RepID=UPI002446DD1A|nr:LacI family DNA-binding transcriptional regulator [Corynebacterium bovis]MDH2456223.1 LacI family DNA-binding transcriptional regulator [Corynebacterium bovis]